MRRQQTATVIARKPIEGDVRLRAGEPQMAETDNHGDRRGC